MEYILSAIKENPPVLYCEPGNNLKINGSEFTIDFNDLHAEFLLTPVSNAQSGYRAAFECYRANLRDRVDTLPVLLEHSLYANMRAMKPRAVTSSRPRS